MTQTNLKRADSIVHHFSELQRMMSDRKTGKSLFIAAALCTVCLCHSGCNRGSPFPPTESVSGAVTLKGKPVEGVEVYFVSDQLVAFGKTDAQGHYDLVQGAVAGENKVYFSKITGGSNVSAIQAGEGMDEYQLQMATASGGKKGGVPKQLIPAEYSDATNPKLNFLVPDGGTDSADFKL